MTDIAAQHVSAAGTVADRLRGARRRRFIGRAAELELFRAALAAPEPPFSVLWVHGLGGVGKTALLAALADEAEAAGHAPIRLDMRAIEPSPPAFRAACGARLERSGRVVLLIDTFETAGALEDWLREELVPGLPAGAVVVIAGRSRPGDAWRQDPGWRDLLRVVSLRNLGPDDVHALLRGAGVGEQLHGRMLELTHGHPLALSLLIDVLEQGSGSEALALALAPDVVGRLVECFVAGVPSPRHRAALELAAQARFTTAGVLRSAFGSETGDALFVWLRDLSFVEVGEHGLFPHDLVREVIDADLRWRDPAAYAELHAHVRRDVIGRIMGTGGREMQRALADLMFLHRGNPAVSAFWDWSSLGQVYAEPAAERDRGALVAMVERHEGRESAAIAAHWLARQPDAFVAFRGGGADPVGFLAQISLGAASEADRTADPVARAIWQHAQRHGAPRPGEEVLVGRFAMDRERYQAPSRSFNVLTMRSTQEWVSRPRLAWYYLVFADPDAVAPLMSYIYFHRAPEADCEVGGRRYAVFAHDWRRDGAAAWLQRMNTRELGVEGAEAQAPPPPAVALSQPEFASAVRRALRDLHRPDALAANPLART
ncbi:MAG TPA: hypothetical protein VN213_09270, partial [Solirubrobacteraceae bacterium]|nr:hypothetical protein [Solirubrobacteraceae bacterium]